MVSMDSAERAGGHLRIGEVVLTVEAAVWLGLDKKTLDWCASRPWRSDGVSKRAPHGFPRAYWLGRTRFYDPADLAVYAARPGGPG